MFSPHEVVGRVVCVLILAGIGSSLLTPSVPTQLTARQIMQIGKQRSKEAAMKSAEREDKLKQRKQNDNAKHSVGNCKRCGIYD